MFDHETEMDKPTFKWLLNFDFYDKEEITVKYPQK